MAPARRPTQQDQRILDAVPQGIIGLDVEGRITFANPTAAGMMGYAVEELQGQPIRTHMQFAGSSTGSGGRTEPSSGFATARRRLAT